MKVLVVDDSPFMRRILVDSLRRIGFGEFVEAGDGVDGLAAFDATIACVITDCVMPKLSGEGLVRALRARADGRSVPVLLMTASSGEVVDPGICGADDVIVKPFTQQMLRDKILQLLGPIGETA